jgi:hypothetical protein
MCYIMNGSKPISRAALWNKNIEEAACGRASFNNLATRLEPGQLRRTAGIHKMVVTVSTLRYRVLCAAALVSAAGCASRIRGSQSSSSVAPQVLETRQETLIGLTRSAGAQMRKQHPGGFAIYPEFLTSRDHRIFTPADSNQATLVEAFRVGARAQYVDRVAVRDTAHLMQLPDSVRYFYTLSSTPAIVGDTGMVDIFESVYGKEDAPLELTIIRYRFVWDPTEGWKYQRRMLLYGA